MQSTYVVYDFLYTPTHTPMLLQKTLDMTGVTQKLSGS